MQSPPATTTSAAGLRSPVQRNAAQRSSIDEVITLFAATGGPTRASLTFRVGTADEPLPARGINHLIGHVAGASAGRDDGRCPVTVSASATTFHITGNALAVANELGAVCHWISTAADGSVDDRLLASARGAAQSDAAPHAPEHASLLRDRFGASAWGAAAFDELGLARLDAATITEWLRRFYTRGNATLALSGTKATTLRLPLPAGEMAPVPTVPDVLRPLPGLLSASHPMLSVGAMIGTEAQRLDRDRAHAGLTCEIIRSRAAYAARKRFAAMKVHGSPMAIGDVGVHCALSGAVAAADEAKVVDIVLESLDLLRARHLVDGELTAHVNRRLAAYERAASQPAGAHELLHRQALGALQDHPWSLPLERRLLSNADDDLTKEQIDAACGSLLVRIADSDPPIRAWPASPPVTAFEPSGAPLQSVPAYGGASSAPPRRIVIDERGVTIRSLTDRSGPPVQRQIAWSDLRVAQVWDDGRHLLTPEHGPGLDVRPEHWRDPDEVCDGLDGRLPEDLTVAMGQRRTPQPPAPRLTDRVSPPAWLAVILAALVVVACAGLPIWPESLVLTRWIAGGVAAAALVLGCWQYAEVRRTERAFRRREPPA